MAEMTESFVSFESFYIQIKDLPDDMKIHLYDAISEYGLYGNEIDLTVIEKAIFLPMKMVMDHSKANRKKNKTNGLNGGRPSKNKPNNNPNKPNETQLKPNHNLNGNGNVNVNGNTHTTEKNNSVAENEPQTVDNSNATEVAGACACDNLQKNITSVLEEHNKTVSSNKQKVPYTPKKISQMISNLPQKDSPETILKALNNYLLVAKHDGWKKTFSLSNFAKEYQDYTPEYFDTERYFKSPPELTQNAEKPPDKKLLSWFICKNCGAVHALDEPSCPNCGSKNREIATGETYPDTYDKAG